MQLLYIVFCLKVTTELDITKNPEVKILVFKNLTKIQILDSQSQQKIMLLCSLISCVYRIYTVCYIVCTWL